MLKRTKTLLLSGFAGLAVLGATAPAVADEPIVQSQDAKELAFKADRATILSLAGDFKVTFDMQESTAWMEGYTPIE